MNRTKYFFFGIILMSLAVACSESDKDKLAKLRTQQKEIEKQIKELESKNSKKDSVVPVPVVATNMTPEAFFTYLELQGKVDAGSSVNASPEAPGVVSAIYVSNGQAVRKGQVLASLRADAIQSGIAELDQQIAFAKTMLDKQKRLWEQEIGTEVQLLSAKNNYESLIKKKNTILSQRNMYSIKAPISGIVDAVNINVGDMANPGFPNMIRIINTSDVKVKVDIPESYGGSVHSGSKSMVIFPDLNDTILTNVQYVQRSIDPVKRTFNAEISPKSATGLRPNMIAQVKIATYENAHAFVLPVRVIQKINAKDYVYIVDKKTNKAKLQEVIVGKNYRGMAEINSGLYLDDLVITTGYEELNEGDKLSVIKN